MKAIRFESQGVPMLIEVRKGRDEELAGYADWAREITYFLIEDRRAVELPKIGIGDLEGKSDGMLPSGCSIWLIDEIQASKLLTLNADRQAAEKEKEKEIPLRGRIIEMGDGLAWMEPDGRIRL